MGNDAKIAHRKAYINVMELLVAEEVNRQLQRLPARVLKYIKRAEVETYALNRLPALYASSEKGLQHQRDHASKTLKIQITSAVRQAFAAVQIDPIRLSKPIQINQDNSDADAVLQALKDCLRSPDLTWETALQKLQGLQRRRQEGGAPSDKASPQLSTQGMISNPSAPPPPSSWRPGTYGRPISWKMRSRRTESGGSFDDTHLR